MAATSLASGLSNEAVSQIEHRQRLPRIDTIERLANTLAVSSAWLAFGEGDASANATATTAEVGQRLAAIRQERGLNRRTLAVAAQLAGQAVANIEDKGTIPRVDTLELLAKALGMSPGWLAFGMGSHPCTFGADASQRNRLGHQEAS